VELGDGQTFVGAAVTDTDVTDAPLVLAVDAAAGGADPADAQLCLPDTLDPALVADAIVVCDRGVNDRVEKSATVAAAGGAGMILVNTTDGEGLNADVHAIPSVHLEDEAYDPIYAYGGTDGATASILARTGDGSTGPTPPAIADFSSRGPSLVADGDLLKPDITAPGVDVLAAVAPEDNSGYDFSVYSGTSMSSPHIAGLGALIKQKHPRWSPMAVKSAMMTTAGNLNATKHPFDQGAGFVKPSEFLDPGLVFDSDFDDWWDYLAGQGVTYADGSPISDTPIRASNLNTPSVAINGLAGRETVWREVTNVDDKAATYSFSTTGLNGVKVTATPSTFTIAPGATKRIQLVFERTKAALGQYATGNLYLTDGPGRHTVRFPAVVKPLGIDVPEELSKNTKRFTVQTKSGVNGTIAARRQGLVAGVDTAGTAQNTGGDAFDPADPRNYRQQIEVGGPGQTLRIQLLSDYTPGDGEDLDLYLTDADGNLYALSATGAVAESITVRGLPEGTYTAHVQAWAVHGGEDSTEFTVRSFRVPAEAAGNWTIAPTKRSVRIAQRQSWQVDARGTSAGTPYLGVIVWRHLKPNGPDPILARTLVSVRP
jgi:Subtilase family/Fibronectin type-III domain/PA domain